MKRGEKGTLTIQGAAMLRSALALYRARECKTKVRKVRKKHLELYEVHVDCPEPLSKPMKEFLKQFVI